MDKIAVRSPIIDQLRGTFIVWSACVVLLPAILEERGTSRRWALLQGQLSPSIWHGCAACDLANAGFLFVAGCSVVFSMSRSRQKGDFAFFWFRSFVQQSLLIFLIGLVVDGGLLSLQWPWRFVGVFQQIAVSRIGVAVVMLFGDWKAALFAAGFILFNYGAALEMEPVNRYASHVDPKGNPLSAVYSMDYNLAARIDQQFLPGRKYFGTWDPQGLAATLPALAIALLGAASSWLLQRRSENLNWLNSWGMTMFSGLALIQAGFLLARWQPMNPWLMTPPFALVAVGACLVIAGMLSWIGQFIVCDAPLTFLSRIGRNCLVLMVLLHLIDQFGFTLFSLASQRIPFVAELGHSLFMAISLALLLGVNSWLTQIRRESTVAN